jgi:2-polyprenyl-6-methoxyphenol hydroxylase-like FAD-dependent oxidoreductase
MSAACTGRAVVMGGSMAGLLAARVLADRYAEVLVLDRDDLAAVTGPRRGVPQARHIHALLPRGREILERLFPGLTAELRADGAAGGDLLGNARLHLGGHRFVRAESQLPALSLSRPFLEDRVRHRVRRRDDVVFPGPCDVVGITTSADRRRVSGVRILRRIDGSAAEMVEADLVIDALGRGSRTPVWLEGLGFTPPPEDRLEVDLGYATRTYRLPPSALGRDWGVLQGQTATRPRGGALSRIEGDRWIVTLFGYRDDHPPRDDEGFLAFARSLAVADLHDALQEGTPLDDAVGFRFPADVRRRYERVDHPPEGLLPFGDSICNLNPIYGQGMTVAALEALALRDHLDATPRRSPARWMRDVAAILDPPWDMVVGGDLAIPTVEGPRSLQVRVLGRYMARLHAGASVDPDLAIAFARVLSLVDPPTTLLRPRIAARVLAHGRSPARAPAPRRALARSPSARADRTQISGEVGP